MQIYSRVFYDKLDVLLNLLLSNQILFSFMIMLDYCSDGYGGGIISLTLKFLKSTSVAVSHLNVVIGPPHDII